MPWSERARNLARLLLLASLPALASCAGAAATPTRPKSLLLVSIDTLRADHLGCYGREDAATPRLDALASSGVLFEDMSAPAPLTAPSHASLLTGTYPPRHGVRSNGFFILSERHVTLVEVFRDAGFQTAGVIGGFPLDSRFGFAQGFGRYDDRLGGEGSSEPERDAAAVTDRAIEALRSFKPDPFFLFVHYYDPHADYEPPSSFSKLAPYQGEIAYVDRELGRLLDALAETVHGKTTAIAIVSDHGESLGEHGEATHAVFVYQAVVHVPCILHFPPSLPRGRRVSGQGSLVDVAPTLIDLLGLRLPPGMDGSSLLPAVSAGKLPERPLYMESLLPRVEFGWAPLGALRKGSLKYIEAPRPELYRIDIDPAERRNLWPKDPAGLALKGELARLFPSWSAPSDTDRRALAPEERERLEALGYLSGAGVTAAGSPEDPKDKIDVLTKMVEALAAFKQGRHAEAEKAYREALAKDAANPVLLKNLGKAVAGQGRIAEAVEILGKAADLASGALQGDILETRAGYALRAGDAKTAERDARNAIERDAGLRQAPLTLARAIAKQGRRDEAEKSLTQTAERSLAAGPLVVLAELLIEEGREEEAARHLATALERDPRDGFAHYYTGLLLLAKGDESKSREHLSSAGKLLREDSRVLTDLAENLVGRGYEPAAEALLRGRLDRTPGDDEARYTLGVILSRTGRSALAVPLLKEVAERRSGDARAWNALGTAHARQGDFRQALPCFRNASKLDPGNASYLENLRAAEEALGSH